MTCNTARHVIILIELQLVVWHCTIFIRQGVYRSGVFRFIMTIPANYPSAPPEIRFVTPIFHPLIGMKRTKREETKEEERRRRGGEEERRRRGGGEEEEERRREEEGGGGGRKREEEEKKEEEEEEH